MSSLLHKGFLIMVNVELFLLEEEVEYHASKNRVLKDELNALQDSRKELLKVNEGVESPEILTRIFEREERIDIVWGHIKRGLEAYIRAFGELTSHRRGRNHV